MSDLDNPSFAPEATRVLWRRFWAHLVDAVIISLPFVAIAPVIGDLPDAPLVIAWLLLGLAAYVAYFVLTQRSGGQSPGKLLLKIKVVDRRGSVPTTVALVRRTVPLLFEQTYLIALVGFLSSEYRQRFGDRWAETYVIRAGAATDERPTPAESQPKLHPLELPPPRSGPAVILIGRYVCPICGASFYTERGARQHAKEIHRADLT